MAFEGIEHCELHVYPELRSILCIHPCLAPFVIVVLVGSHKDGETAPGSAASGADAEQNIPADNDLT